MVGIIILCKDERQKLAGRPGPGRTRGSQEPFLSGIWAPWFLAALLNPSFGPAHSLGFKQDALSEGKQAFIQIWLELTLQILPLPCMSDSVVGQEDRLGD